MQEVMAKRRSSELLTDVQSAYLDLLAGCLTRSITGGESYATYTPPAKYARLRGIWEQLDKTLRKRGFRLMRVFPYDAENRENGSDWPPDAETMVGLKRLRNLRELITQINADGVPGDFVETGVWRGGASIFMRGMLKALGDTSRTVWVCDSFQGLPPPNPEKYPADTGDRHHTVSLLAITEETVRANFARYSLLDDQVQTVRGWFKDTLPGLPARKVALLRLDGDMYESTMDGLSNLYDRVPTGGFVIVDDYGAVPACKKAVTDFRAARGITDPIQIIDWAGAYWRKQASS